MFMGRLNWEKVQIKETISIGSTCRGREIFVTILKTMQ